MKWFDMKATFNMYIIVAFIFTPVEHEFIAKYAITLPTRFKMAQDLISKNRSKCRYKTKHKTISLEPSWG